MRVARFLLGSPFHFGVFSQPVVTRVVVGASQRLAWKKMSIQPSDVVNHLHEWYCERKSAGTPPSPNGVIGGSMRDRTRGSGIHDHEGR